MRITVAGMHCARTERTLTNVREAASKFGDEVEVVWKESPLWAPEQGATHTPSVVVNNRVKVSGRIPSLYELEQWIADELEDELAA
jgi:hypothetical protein